MICIRGIDSHTGGEPTRTVVSGFPDLGGGSIAQRRERFLTEFDRWRSALAGEPRGSDAVVGALLLPPSDPSCATGVIFFNNVGYLGMCGHGTIGVVRTLAHLGRLQPGVHRIETPTGVVSAELHPDLRVSVDNVESYRFSERVAVEVPGYGKVQGDVAWGGNWFFITADTRIDLEFSRIRELTSYAEAIRHALQTHDITGADGAEIDHIELNVHSAQACADARNFVLCPGLAYDRSPCGTGTSAKLACLAADGKLAPGNVWRQESIIGSRFEASYRTASDGRIHVQITGTAHITADAQWLLDPTDPFVWGIR
jgi:4-hydroxyproline epimerase